MIDVDLVTLAHMVSRQLHQGQKYGDNEPYFEAHILKVVDILIRHGGDDDIVAAGYLHDTIEDTSMTYEVLHDLFNPRIAMMVLACTGHGDNRQERNKCIYKRVNAYPLAATVKVADRIANLEGAPLKWKQMYRKERAAFHKNVANYAPLDLQDRLDKAYANDG